MKTEIELHAHGATFITCPQHYLRPRDKLSLVGAAIHVAVGRFFVPVHLHALVCSILDDNLVQLAGCALAVVVVGSLCEETVGARGPREGCAMPILRLG